jgi:hypothetical protein
MYDHASINSNVDVNILSSDRCLIKSIDYEISDRNMATSIYKPRSVRVSADRAFYKNNTTDVLSYVAANL